MSQVLKEVLAANERYSSSFTKGDLAMPPARRFAILTCMDARLDPAKYAGLERRRRPRHPQRRRPRQRRRDPVARDLVQAARQAEWFVIHHTDCGMEFFTDEVMRGLLASSLETAELDAAKDSTTSGRVPDRPRATTSSG